MYSTLLFLSTQFKGIYFSSGSAVYCCVWWHFGVLREQTSFKCKEWPVRYQLRFFFIISFGNCPFMKTITLNLAHFPFISDIFMLCLGSCSPFDHQTLFSSRKRPRGSLIHAGSNYVLQNSSHYGLMDMCCIFISFFTLSFLCSCSDWVLLIEIVWNWCRNCCYLHITKKDDRTHHGNGRETCSPCVCRACQTEMIPRKEGKTHLWKQIGWTLNVAGDCNNVMVTTLKKPVKMKMACSLARQRQNTSRWSADLIANCLSALGLETPLPERSSSWIFCLFNLK